MRDTSGCMCVCRRHQVDQHSNVCFFRFTAAQTAKSTRFLTHKSNWRGCASAFVDVSTDAATYKSGTLCRVSWLSREYFLFLLFHLVILLIPVFSIHPSTDVSYFLISKVDKTGVLKKNNARKKTFFSLFSTTPAFVVWKSIFWVLIAKSNDCRQDKRTQTHIHTHIGEGRRKKEGKSIEKVEATVIFNWQQFEGRKMLTSSSPGSFRIDLISHPRVHTRTKPVIRKRNPTHLKYTKCNEKQNFTKGKAKVVWKSQQKNEKTRKGCKQSWLPVLFDEWKEVMCVCPLGSCSSGVNSGNTVLEKGSLNRSVFKKRVLSGTGGIQMREREREKDEGQSVVVRKRR